MSTGHWQTGGPRSRMQSLGSHAVEEILGFALRQGIASRSLGRAWFILQGTPASSVAPKTNTSAHWARVAVACNPSYSGGRDQEERGSKPAPAKQFGNHLSRKKTLPQKKGWWSGSRGRPQYRKERKKSQACVARSLLVPSLFQFCTCLTAARTALHCKRTRGGGWGGARPRAQKLSNAKSVRVGGRVDEGACSGGVSSVTSGSHGTLCPDPRRAGRGCNLRTRERGRPGSLPVGSQSASTH
jgi:hypothetical protein